MRTGTHFTSRWLAGRLKTAQGSALAYLLDVALFPIAVVLAFWLRFDGGVPASRMHNMRAAICVWTFAQAAAFVAARIRRSTWRNASIFDASRILLAVTLGTAFGGAILALLRPTPAIPRSIYCLEWVLTVSMALGARLICRIVLAGRRPKRHQESLSRVVIYGAGTAGIALLREFRQNPSLQCDPVGFVDDDAAKAKQILEGKPVLGTGEDLPGLVSKHKIDRVLIAIPSATGVEMTRILHLASQAKVEFKAVPGLGELIKSAGLGQQIRDVAVEDLLGRHPANLDLGRIRARIHGKVVMVTGAAGSIGSELCRQLARFEPSALVALDAAETALFHLERAMAELHPEITFYPEIGSINNRQTVDRIVAQYRPTAIYHAAAYKHVPLMEMHAFAAIETNVFGTWNVARAAIKNGVDDFVMISTDKAVRPTSMMGATKRFAELIIRAMQQDYGTKFVAVRFGNVLGSNGSVVPIFKEQIAAGGPVTVTHPDVTRYFMTIPEAVQLVLQAYTFGRGGEVFVLEMGDPVKIADLASNLILLSGLQPGKDIEIRYTGLRPGEKLHEELHLTEENLISTSHPQIGVYEGIRELDEQQMESVLRRLRSIMGNRDLASLLLLLKELIPDYNPGAQLLKRAFRDGAALLEADPGPSLPDELLAAAGAARYPVSYENA